jgi:hypothetical protein
MTQEDIIRMAVASQLITTASKDGVYMKALERFAALVETAATEAANARATSSWTLMCKKMVAAENEACAKVVEASPSYDWHKFACEAAHAIRARGQA